MPAVRTRWPARPCAHLEAAGWTSRPRPPRRRSASIQETLFDVLVLFLSTMALLLGVVGALGSTGTMTINVVERSREIGVMRAIGARTRRC